jgi:hypothetical protein
MKLINIIENKVKDREYRKGLPTNHRVEDIFLVSFPKSGNTWSRFLIANAVKVHFAIETEVNFFSILEIIPAVKNNKKGKTVNLRSSGMFGRTDLPRIIKSHSSYNPYFNRVILLVRDPRDVICSWFNYLKHYQKIEPDTKLSDFLDSPRYGIDTWVSHTESWCFNQTMDQKIKIFRYEDLLKDTTIQLQLIMELLGMKMTEEELGKAIELSSKENMKKLEYTRTSELYLEDKQANFVNQRDYSKGIELTESDRLLIEQKTSVIASKLGYKF